MPACCEKDVGIAAERHHAFLNSRATGIVQADDRRSHLHGEIHDLADLLGIGFAERAAENGEVLGEDVNETAIDAAVSGDHAVAGILLLLHSEIEAAMVTNLSISSKESLSSRSATRSRAVSLAVGLLAFQALLAAAKFGRAIQCDEMFDAGRCSHFGHKGN